MTTYKKKKLLTIRNVFAVTFFEGKIKWYTISVWFGLVTKENAMVVLAKFRGHKINGYKKYVSFLGGTVIFTNR